MAVVGLKDTVIVQDNPAFSVPGQLVETMPKNDGFVPPNVRSTASGPLPVFCRVNGVLLALVLTVTLPKA